jgi:hypothetical protein
MPLRASLMASFRWRVRRLNWKARVWVFRRKFGWALLDDYRRDRELGWAGGYVRSSAHQGAMLPFASAHHWELERIFRADKGLEISTSDVLVDFGCGRGRVINWWLSRGFENTIYGLELDEELADETAQRLRAYRNVTIIGGDGLAHLPADGTLFFLFNPFHPDATGTKLMERLSRQLRDPKRPAVRVALFRSELARVFEADPYWQVTRFPGRVDAPPHTEHTSQRPSGLFYSLAVITPVR